VPSFFLHIGLPKTATTTLQERLFPALGGVHYVGIPMTDGFAAAPGDGARHRLLAECFRRSERLWAAVGDDVLAEFLGPKQRWLQQPTSVLASDEGVGRTASRTALLGAHLSSMERTVRSWGFDDLRVLCVFRRQDEWLASHYAQVSDRKPAPSQQDFEATVSHVLDPHAGRFKLGAMLDYQSLHEALEGAVGADRLLMLPYERLRADPAGFDDALCAFVGTPVPETGSAEAVRNARSDRPGTWRLRRRPTRVERSLRRIHARLPLPDRLSTPSMTRPGTIELTAVLREQILDAYAVSNRALGRRLGTDLSTFGYHPAPEPAS
jgi:hypothetical protein